MAKQQWGYTYRKYGGKRYRIGTWHPTKGEAEAKAEWLRKRGYKVRTVKRKYDGKVRYVIYALEHH